MDGVFDLSMQMGIARKGEHRAEKKMINRLDGDEVCDATEVQ